MILRKCRTTNSYTVITGNIWGGFPTYRSTTVRWKFSSANLPAIQNKMLQSTLHLQDGGLCKMYCHFEIFTERRNFRRTTVRGEPERNQMVSTWSFSELNRVVLNSRKNLKTLKESTYNSHFFHSFIFIFANNAKIHDRLLYWAPLTYKTNNKHTLHSMIHTNTFF